jgi:hypothetical protein
VGWPENPQLTKYSYDRGEGRTKHCWKRDMAGFMPSKRGLVGKCHRSISDPVAQNLLRSGFFGASEYEDETVAPDMIFNVYRGVPYVAVATEPGKTYHGYPWRGRMAATIRAQLRARAQQEGTEKVFDRWLTTHTPRK